MDNVASNPYAIGAFFYSALVALPILSAIFKERIIPYFICGFPFAAYIGIYLRTWVAQDTIPIDRLQTPEGIIVFYIVPVIAGVTFLVMFPAIYHSYRTDEEADNG